MAPEFSFRVDLFRIARKVAGDEGVLLEPCIKGGALMVGWSKTSVFVVRDPDAICPYPVQVRLPEAFMQSAGQVATELGVTRGRGLVVYLLDGDAGLAPQHFKGVSAHRVTGEPAGDNWRAWVNPSAFVALRGAVDLDCDTCADLEFAAKHLATAAGADWRSPMSRARLLGGADGAAVAKFPGWRDAFMLIRNARGDAETQSSWAPPDWAEPLPRVGLVAQ